MTAIHEPSAEPQLEAAAGLVLLLARQNAQLEAAWRQSQHELSRVRAGVALASDMVRRRLGQDLHDGAQQRLTAIRIRLELAREQARDDGLAEQLAAIGAELDQA